MNNVIQLLWHNVDEAYSCIIHFKDDYEMYASWCKQFRTTSDGKHVRLIPVPIEVYNGILKEYYHD